MRLSANARRELQKAEAALQDCQEYLSYVGKANAKLHLADEVLYSPLYSKIASVRAGLTLILAEGQPNGTSPS